MLSKEEQRNQVVFSLLMPAARLATHFGTPLREMKRLVELSVYQEARRRDLKMKEIRSRLSISMSKVGLLSKELKAHFAQPTEQFGLPRTIMKLLWSGPLTEARIVGALTGVETAEVSVALEELVEQKRVKILPGRTVRYALGEPQYRLVQDPWMARIDALNNLTLSLVQAIEARFFRADARAFARTLSFRVRPEDMPRLRELYEEKIFDLVCELDALATEDEDSVPINLSVLWAPDEEWDDEGGGEG